MQNKSQPRPTDGAEAPSDLSADDWAEKHAHELLGTIHPEYVWPTDVKALATALRAAKAKGVAEGIERAKYIEELFDAFVGRVAPKAVAKAVRSLPAEKKGTV